MKPTKTKGRVLDSKIYARFYDAYMKLVWFGKDEKFRNHLLSFVDIKKNHDVLDVGCGTGTLALKIAEKVRRVTGIDASKEMVSVAKEKSKNTKNVNIIEAIMENLPFKDNSFDVVICSMTIHHLPTEDKINALKEMKRVLKKKGQFLLVDFGKSDCKKGKIVKFLWGYEPYIKDNFEGKLVSLAKKAGFNKVEKDKGCGIISYIKATKN